MTISAETWPPAPRLPSIAITGVRVESWTYSHRGAELPSTVVVDVSVAGLVERSTWTVYILKGDPEPALEMKDAISNEVFDFVSAELIDRWHETAATGDRSWWNQ